ncbi:MAG: CHASE3 domain-containing protein [Nitrospiraceae bacterium]
MQRRQEKYIWIGLGVAFLLFLSMAVVVYQSTTGFMQTASETARSHEIRSTFHRIGNALDDIETSHQAYITSGEVHLVEWYKRSANRVRARVKEVRELEGDIPRNQKRLNRLEKLVTNRLDVTEQSFNIASSQGFAAARLLLQPDRDSREIEEVRRLLKELIDEAGAEISGHSKRNEALAESTILFVAGGSLIILAFVLGSGGSISWTSRGVNGPKKR